METNKEVTGVNGDGGGKRGRGRVRTAKWGGGTDHTLCPQVGWGGMRSVFRGSGRSDLTSAQLECSGLWLGGAQGLGKGMTVTVSVGSSFCLSPNLHAHGGRLELLLSSATSPHCLVFSHHSLSPSQECCHCQPCSSSDRDPCCMRVMNAFLLPTSST